MYLINKTNIKLSLYIIEYSGKQHHLELIYIESFDYVDHIFYVYVIQIWGTVNGNWDTNDLLTSTL